MASKCCVVLWCAFFMSCLLVGQATDHIVDPKWIKPGALDRWEQEQRQRHKTEETCEAQVLPTVECDCPALAPPSPSETTDDQRLAPVFYRKLVTMVFARDALQLDGSGELYRSELSLKVTARQLEKLTNEASSVREIDSTLSEIVEQSNTIRQKNILQEYRCERLYGMLIDFAESRILYSVLPIILLLMACFAVRIISRYTRLHPIVVFLLLILSLTIVNKWKECNANLAKKALRNMEKSSSPSSKSVWNLWSSVESNDHPQNGPTICDPLQVIVESTVSIQAVYMKELFKHFIETYEESTHEAGYFKQLIVGLLMLGFAYLAITTVLKLGIAHGFHTFGNVVTAGLHMPRHAVTNNDTANAPQQMPAVNLNITIGDPSGSSLQQQQQARLDAASYLLQNQRIEILPAEPAVPAIENPKPVQIDAKKQDTRVIAKGNITAEAAGSIEPESSKDETNQDQKRNDA